ncbi:hypothetical protein H0H87_001238 [Tephrocybe sp. NHM501043]|nr:hypothetical protein H0H87_001238 [Tephrocybe sp. NHM501043]
MDNKTAATLQAIGADIVRSFAAIVVETFLLAIYTTLVFKASRIIMLNARTRISMITLAVIILLFLLSLVLWGFDITDFVRLTRITLIRDPDLPMMDKYDKAQQKLFGLLAPLDLIYAYMYSVAVPSKAILGDGIVVWRVYVLWGQTNWKWIVILPFALLAGSFGAFSKPRTKQAIHYYFP